MASFHSMDGSPNPNYQNFSPESFLEPHYPSNVNPSALSMSPPWPGTVNLVNLDDVPHLPLSSQFRSGYLGMYPEDTDIYAPAASGQQAPYEEHSRTNDFKADNNFLPQMWQFNSRDLGMSQQNPNPYKCASVACSKRSCSSKCCSSSGVCQDENCPSLGKPCNDVGCLHTAPTETQDLMDPFGMFSSDLEYIPLLPHSGQCDHTDVEHDVAFTLEVLRRPAKPDAQEQFSSHRNAIVSGAGDQFLECSSPSFPSEYVFHTQPLLPASHEADQPEAPYHIEPIRSASNETEAPFHTEPIRSASNETDGPETPEPRICRWITNRDEPKGEKMICGKEFSDSKAFEDHLRDIHCAELSSKTGYNCLWHGCPRNDGKGFGSGSKLRRHMTTHSAYKAFECDFFECNNRFSTQQALVLHKRTHTKEKPFVCSFLNCGKSFPGISQLTVHERTHTGYKPFACGFPGCDQKFGESSNLAKHRKTHTKQKNHICKFEGCGSSFIRADQLRRHEKCHKDEQWHEDGHKITRHRRKAATRSNVSEETHSSRQLSPGTPSFNEMAYLNL
ncbi:hypothetical protein HD806DRAFT_481881 [Xylariaceae sp. AK1471]|nr:hypothetical protein HD806DRAFT_481881 [Xylariaceae sp. AK1471]